MREQIMIHQSLEFLYNFTQEKKKKMKLYNEKLNRLEAMQKIGINSSFENELYQLTRTRYENMKKVEVLINRFWKQMR